MSEIKIIITVKNPFKSNMLLRVLMDDLARHMKKLNDARIRMGIKPLDFTVDELSFAIDDINKIIGDDIK